MSSPPPNPPSPPFNPQQPFPVPTTPRRHITSSNNLLALPHTPPLQSSRRRVSSWDPTFNKVTSDDFGGVGASPSAPASPRPSKARQSLRRVSIFKGTSEWKEGDGINSLDGSIQRKLPWEEVMDTAQPQREGLRTLMDSIISGERSWGHPSSINELASREYLDLSIPPAASSVSHLSTVQARSSISPSPSLWKPSVLLKEIQLAMKQSGVHEVGLEMVDGSGMLRLGKEEVNDMVKIDEGMIFLLDLPPIDHYSKALAKFSSSAGPSTSSYSSSSTRLSPASASSCLYRPIDPHPSNLSGTSDATTKDDEIRAGLEKRRARVEEMGEWGKMFLGEKWPKIHDWIVAYLQDYKSAHTSHLENLDVNSSGTSIRPRSQAYDHLPPLPDTLTLLLLTHLLSTVSLLHIHLNHALLEYAFQDQVKALVETRKRCLLGLEGLQEGVRDVMRSGMKALKGDESKVLQDLVSTSRQIIMRHLPGIQTELALFGHHLYTLREYRGEGDSVLDGPFMSEFMRLDGAVQGFVFEREGWWNQGESMQLALERMNLLCQRRSRIEGTTSQAKAFLQVPASSLANTPGNKAWLDGIERDLDDDVPNSLFARPLHIGRGALDEKCGFSQAQEECRIELQAYDKQKIALLGILDECRSALDLAQAQAAADSASSFTPANQKAQLGMDVYVEGSPGTIERSVMVASDSKTPKEVKVVNKRLDQAIRDMASKPGIGIRIKATSRSEIEQEDSPGQSISASYNFALGTKSSTRLCRIYTRTDHVVVRDGGGWLDLIDFINSTFKDQMSRAAIAPLPIDTSPTQIIGQPPSDIVHSTSIHGDLSRSRRSSIIRPRSITSSPSHRGSPFPRSTPTPEGGRDTPASVSRGGSASPELVIRHTKPSGSLSRSASGNAGPPGTWPRNRRSISGSSGNVNGMVKSTSMGGVAMPRSTSRMETSFKPES